MDWGYVAVFLMLIFILGALLSGLADVGLKFVEAWERVQMAKLQHERRVYMQEKMIHPYLTASERA